MAGASGLVICDRADDEAQLRQPALDRGLRFTTVRRRVDERR